MLPLGSAEHPMHTAMNRLSAQRVFTLAPCSPFSVSRTFGNMMLSNTVKAKAPVAGRRVVVAKAGKYDEELVKTAVRCLSALLACGWICSG